ncbi:MAG: response regulator [Burkholderiaceae bacterium]|nr:response regulator [Burkholderiaceae bacterium]
MTEPIRVLLVEDNAGDADLIRETLETGEFHLEIAVAVDGVQAISYLLRKPPYTHVELPDIVMLDLNLPKMSGQEVLAQIKLHSSLRAIPIVVLTSSDAEQDIGKSYELGANCYVTKPVGLAAFQSIIKAVENFWLTVVKLP